MWEIVIKSRETGIVKKFVTGYWVRAPDIARDAAGNGFLVSLSRYYTDVLIADHVTGDYLLVATRLDPREASRFSYQFAKEERDRGCTLWPHGRMGALRRWVGE